MLEESEDYILSQVASEILNRENNPKGEESYLERSSQITQLFVCSKCWHSENVQTSIEDHMSEHASNIVDSSQQCYFLAVEFTSRDGMKTKYGIKFFNENLIFYALPDEALSMGSHTSDECAGTVLDEQSQRASPTTEWSIQYSAQETQLPLGGNSGPSYNAINFSTKLQEGYYQNPSIFTEQTILSETVNLERKESLDSINLSYPTIIEDNLQPTYLPEHLDLFHPTYTSYVGEFDDGFTSFSGMHHTHLDASIIQ
ncbi:hypothetical protein PNOK_0909900 [Pyrrhoderma noxium]|uniref:Uncharacterized protein n=1 Tax=Pyrrhoderma noxium TaxID=2282107 RepID=A0A286U6Z3_9AGAM|nr:hypothetical protein PNOK_0909900 [Pyrrhoderma noxium]